MRVGQSGLLGAHERSTGRRPVIAERCASDRSCARLGCRRDGTDPTPLSNVGSEPGRANRPPVGTACGAGRNGSAPNGSTGCGATPIGDRSDARAPTSIRTVSRRTHPLTSRTPRHRGVNARAPPSPPPSGRRSPNLVPPPSPSSPLPFLPLPRLPQRHLNASGATSTNVIRLNTCSASTGVGVAKTNDPSGCRPPTKCQ